MEIVVSCGTGRIACATEKAHTREASSWLPKLSPTKAARVFFHVLTSRRLQPGALSVKTNARPIAKKRY